MLSVYSKHSSLVNNYLKWIATSLPTYATLRKVLAPRNDGSGAVII